MIAEATLFSVVILTMCMVAWSRHFLLCNWLSHFHWIRDVMYFG